MSLNVAICVNDGIWRRGAFTPNTKVADLDSTIVLIWRNLKRVYNTSDRSRSDNNQITFQQLGVQDKNILYVYTQSFASFLIPVDGNFSSIVPLNVRKILAFADAASAAFEMSKFSGNRGVRNVPTRQQLDTVSRFLASMTSNSLFGDQTRKLAESVFKTMSENPYWVALDYPDLVSKFIANKPTYEQFVPMFESALKEQARQKLVIERNPDSEEGQKLIQEKMNRDKIVAMYETSHDYHPEHHIPVTMLYINLTINGVAVKAFIDSGAQVSIMSSACARRCHLEHLIDKRFQGFARGVGGEEQFEGKIHLCDVKVENAHFLCPFNIMANRDMDLLIGLNVLRAHNVSLNLARNMLQFPNGTETPFLQSNEIDKHLTEVVGSNPAVDMEVDEPSTSSEKPK